MLIKETNLNATYHHSTLFNNSKYNKNIISFFGLFIIGVLYYIIFGAVNILVREGWITDLHGSMDLFVHCCIWPVVLPTIYFMRNPKHLKSVLQDHNLMQIDHFEQKNTQKNPKLFQELFYEINRHLRLQVLKSLHDLQIIYGINFQTVFIFKI